MSTYKWEIVNYTNVEDKWKLRPRARRGAEGQEKRSWGRGIIVPWSRVARREVEAWQPYQLVSAPKISGERQHYRHNSYTNRLIRTGTGTTSRQTSAIIGLEAIKQTKQNNFTTYWCCTQLNSTQNKIEPMCYEHTCVHTVRARSKEWNLSWGFC